MMHIETIINCFRGTTNPIEEEVAMKLLFKYKRSIHPCPSWASLGVTLKDQEKIAEICKRIGHNTQTENLKTDVKADDIKHQNRLSDEDIAGIHIDKVYEWVRTGKWKQKDFRRWLRVIRVIE